MSGDAPLTLGDFAEMDLERLKGVGEKRIASLAAVGVHNVLDLLTYYPRRWIDRTREARLADLRVGEEALVLVEVRHISSRRTRSRPPKVMVTADVSDGSGHLRLTFFNQAWRERQLKAGTHAAVYGKLEVFGGRKQMTNPVVDLIGDKTGRVVPVYPQSEKAGLSTWELGGWVAEVLRRSKVRGIADPVPEAVLDRFDLTGREQALWGIHAPDTMDEKDAARRRLVFDELLRIQVALVLRKQIYEQTARGIRHQVGGALVTRFVERLPFELTDGQAEAIAEIEADMAGPHPMHRLLQGDVGVGKTVVAVAAMLSAVQGGHQAALMAPTEVLAEQHGIGIRRLLDGFTVPAGEGAGMLFDERPLGVELLTSRTTAKERERLRAALADGTADLVIGTHALIEDVVQFRSLGMVVVDEQHRFGVDQRSALREKGAGGSVPDVLVMTATPIPRTAAMTVYGDLDVTTIRQSPGGRKPIETRWEKTPAAGDGQLSLAELQVWQQVREEVAAGHQAYVVCPLIEESEKLEVRSAEATFAELDGGRSPASASACCTAGSGRPRRR